MPVILIVAVLAVLLLSHRADASTAGGYGGANQAPPPAFGPSTGKAAQWRPPTDIVITRLDPIAAGQNRYGGNEADPRIAGGCWLNPGQSPPNQCCYDLATSKTTCDRPVDCNGGPCHTYNFTTPGTVPPPPPPPTLAAASWTGVSHFN